MLSARMRPAFWCRGYVLLALWHLPSQLRSARVVAHGNHLSSQWDGVAQMLGRLQQVFASIEGFSGSCTNRNLSAGIATA
jgi:hypothetical protein